MFATVCFIWKHMSKSATEVDGDDLLKQITKSNANWASMHDGTSFGTASSVSWDSPVLTNLSQSCDGLFTQAFKLSVAIHIDTFGDCHNMLGSYKKIQRLH